MVQRRIGRRMIWSVVKRLRLRRVPWWLFNITGTPWIDMKRNHLTSTVLIILTSCDPGRGILYDNTPETNRKRLLKVLIIDLDSVNQAHWEKQLPFWKCCSNVFSRLKERKSGTTPRCVHLIGDNSTLAQVIRAPSHYLARCWPRAGFHESFCARAHPMRDDVTM